jgi:hypothetical protein
MSDHAPRALAIEKVLIRWKEQVSYLEALRAEGKLTKDWGECSLNNARRIVEDLTDALAVASTMHPEQQRIADELNKRQALSSTKAWECEARRQSLPEPADCNWPDCGCDPHAMKVIESLLEQGWTAPALSSTERETL